MEKTGNVFMDAMLKAGMEMSGDTFVDWANREDYVFPFGVRRGASRIYYLEKGYTTMYNAVRRIAENIDMSWIKRCNAVRTDNWLLTWMKANTSLLKLVDSTKLSDVYSKHYSGWSSEVSDYEHLPFLWEDGVEIYIEYQVVNSAFVVKTNFDNTVRIHGSLAYDTDVAKILNWISQNRDKVEFIPVVVSEDFTISHKEYWMGSTYHEAVNVSYFGEGILKSSDAMKRLKNWLEEGNVINPKNEYYILASKGNRYNCYLRRKKVGDDCDREAG